MPRFKLLLLTTLPAALALGACGNSKPATAMVTTIDRKCNIIEQSYEESSAGERKMGAKRSYEGECHEIDDWEKVKKKRGMNLKGHADIHLSYAGPDGKSYTGKIRVTGRDSEFYDLKSGDSVKIMVDPDKPERIYFS